MNIPCAEIVSFTVQFDLTKRANSYRLICMAASYATWPCNKYCVTNMCPVNRGDVSLTSEMISVRRIITFCTISKPVGVFCANKLCSKCMPYLRSSIL